MEFEKIAVVAGKDEIDQMTAPCGVCRQVMMEFCNPKTFTISMPVAHQPLHQRRRAHIGVSHNIHKTGFMHSCSFNAKAHPRLMSRCAFTYVQNCRTAPAYAEE